MIFLYPNSNLGFGFDARYETSLTEN